GAGGRARSRHPRGARVSRGSHPPRAGARRGAWAARPFLGGYTEVMEITAAPLDAVAVTAAVARAGDGAVATFVGLVRRENAGRQVLWLDYEAYAPLAIKAFERIARE